MTRALGWLLGIVLVGDAALLSWRHDLTPAEIVDVWIERTFGPLRRLLRL